jgi:hypothetical protein
MSVKDVHLPLLIPSAALFDHSHNETNLEYMVGDEDTRRIIGTGQLCGEVHTTENQVGVALWIRPENDLFFRRTSPRMPSEDVRKRLAPTPHWYLMVLAADASQPEKTIYAALIEPVLSRADETGMPCYLETISANRLAFFQDCGFQITGAGRISGGGPNFWAMSRAAVSPLLAPRRESPLGCVPTVVGL